MSFSGYVGHTKKTQLWQHLSLRHMLFVASEKKRAPYSITAHLFRIMRERVSLADSSNTEQGRVTMSTESGLACFFKHILKILVIDIYKLIFKVPKCRSFMGAVTSPEMAETISGNHCTYPRRMTRLSGPG